MTERTAAEVRTAGREERTASGRMVPKAARRRGLRVPGGLAAVLAAAAVLGGAPGVGAQDAPSPGLDARTAPPPPSRVPDGLFEALPYRHIGPVGNRVIAVAGEPGDPNVYYIGAASGGVWKSTDGGHAWTPVFDEQPAASIGALTLAPSDPSVVWVGTGETFIRSNISLGNGVYRSTDGGGTWEHLGLEGTGRIGRIVVHPTDPDVALVCALGHTYGPQPDRGVYRTADGGESWERTLHVDEDTGCADLAANPRNPRILFAGMWQFEQTHYSRASGGPGSGLWRSTDGGRTWTELTGPEGAAEGLPEKPLGKIGLGTSADDPDRVYALIETSSNREFAPVGASDGVLWRSDDGGDTWEMVNAGHDLAARPLYYSRLAVAPDDADEVYFNAPSHHTSLDGGRTHSETDPEPGYDHHVMWIDPEDPDRMIVGHDGGVSISTDRGGHWHRPLLPIAQMYHVHVDDRIPYRVYGNRQDGPSTRGPSNSLTGSEIPIGMWRSVGGCEVGFAVPDTVDDRTVWTGCYDGILERHDLESRTSRDVSVWPVAVESWPAEDLEYRWQWTFPIEISPHDHERVYVGSQYVHVTTDGGRSWERLSPDLTTDDPELQRRTGGLTLDDAGPTIAPVVFAIAESPAEEGVLWAGSNDGLVHVSRDGGEGWTDVTANLPGLPPRGVVSNIHPSRHAAGKAYLTVDRHQLGDFEPYIYRTPDYGESWRRIDGDIPRSVFSFTHVVIEDPERPGLLYAGTENGIWISFDEGESWHSFQSNLPHAPVHWLAVQDRFGDLAVATYGRGFWILDDLTPLREMSDATLGDAPHLFIPRPAWRFRSRAEPFSQPGDPAAGTNPEYGASLNYWIPEPEEDGAESGDPSGGSGEADGAGAEEDDAGGDDAGNGLVLEILNASGDVVRTLSDIPSDPGLHRVHWDLRGERTREVRLRTKPEEHAHVSIPDRGWREMPDGRRISILQPPGSYTVRLVVGDDTLSRPLEVRKDPNSPGSKAGIAAQLEILESLWNLQDRGAVVLNEIEWIRRQLYDLEARLEAMERPAREDGRPGANRADEGPDGPDEGPDGTDEGPDGPAAAVAADLRAAADSLDAALKEVEGRFFDLRHTDQGQDGLRWKRLLYARLGSLASSVGDSDLRPTEQHRGVHDLLRERVEEAEARYREVREGPVGDFNARLRDRGLEGIIADAPRATDAGDGPAGG